MKTLIKFALAAVIFTATVAAHAGWVNGYTRRDGTYVSGHYRSDFGSLGGSSSASRDYVYRNPYAANPSVSVNGYFRGNGTYVAPHVRTAPNDTLTDNLTYRGFGTIRVPKSSFGGDFSLPTAGFSAPRTLPSFRNDFSLRPLGK